MDDPGSVDLEDLLWKRVDHDLTMRHNAMPYTGHTPKIVVLTWSPGYSAVYVAVLENIKSHTLRMVNR